jgi:Proliferating cell nuclear antigen, C-terminal domain
MNYFAENEEEEEKEEEKQEIVQEPKRQRTETPAEKADPKSVQSLHTQFEAVFLKTLLAFLVPFQPTIPITVQPSGLFIEATNTSHTSVVRIALTGLKVFSGGNLKFAFSGEKLASVIDSMPRGGRVTLTHSSDTTLLNVHAIYNGIVEKKDVRKGLEREINYRLSLIDDEREAVEIVDTPCGSVIIESEAFFQILDNLLKSADLVTLTLRRESLRFSVGTSDGEGGEHIIHQHTSAGSLQTCLFFCEPEQEIEAIFSLSLMNQLKPLRTLAPQLTVRIPKAMPLCISVTLEYGELNFYLAPQISD